MPRMTPVTQSESSRADHPGLKSLVVRSVVGEAIRPYLDNIAGLRAIVLREWPYLSSSGASSHAVSLQRLLESWQSIAVMVFDGDQMVGASIGAPLSDIRGPLHAALIAANREIDQTFHLGGSVLLRPYRGRGLGQGFFDQRESHARALGGFDTVTFCVVDRAADDPRRPPFGRSNDQFWASRGYRRREDLEIASRWDEVDASQVPHRLVAWSRPLERTFK